MIPDDTLKNNLKNIFISIDGEFFIPLNILEDEDNK